MMGIDPGTRACGWAVGTLSGTLIDSGALVLTRTEDTELRMYTIAEILSLKAQEHRVDAVYCEAPFSLHNPKVIITLAGLSYVIRYVLYKESDGQLRTNMIEPTTVRRLIGVPSIAKLPKGQKHPKGIGKSQALTWIRNLLDDMGLPYNTEKKVPLGEEDRLEAIAVYWAGCNEFSGLLTGRGGI